MFLGDSCTDKSHVQIGLSTAAWKQRRTVRYVMAPTLVNELAGATDEKRLTKLVARYDRVDLLLLDLWRIRDAKSRAQTRKTLDLRHQSLFSERLINQPLVAVFDARVPMWIEASNRSTCQ